ncbi:hypothetical protein [Streptomyces sp. enrichment culture]|uniref:hypothetical protein n=1 Tax=Streptomyces sp. enrichment culture TaxID=1795815 RepID=UPI003F57FF28
MPALTVQDEMHLLKKELGAFNAHYEGMIAELQSGAGSGLPSKVPGASVTIEQYQDQLRQLYSNFLSYHRLLDRMVTPVPVNKYAYFAARRTLPGIVLALLHDAARDLALKPPPEGADYSKDFKRWWSAPRPLLDPWLERRIPACYRERVEGVNGRGLENDLVARIMDTWRQEERPNLNKGAEEKRTAYLFLQQPLTSFRDIDKSTAFQSLTSSQDAFKALATNTADSKGGEDEPQP